MAFRFAISLLLQNDNSKNNMIIDILLTKQGLYRKENSQRNKECQGKQSKFGL